MHQLLLLLPPPPNWSSLLCCALGHAGWLSFDLVEMVAAYLPERLSFAATAHILAGEQAEQQAEAGAGDQVMIGPEQQAEQQVDEQKDSLG